MLCKSKCNPNQHNSNKAYTRNFSAVTYIHNTYIILLWNEFSTLVVHIHINWIWSPSGTITNWQLWTNATSIRKLNNEKNYRSSELLSTINLKVKILTEIGFSSKILMKKWWLNWNMPSKKFAAPNYNRNHYAVITHLT